MSSAFFQTLVAPGNLQYAISLHDTRRVPVIFGPFLFFLGTSRNLSHGGKKRDAGRTCEGKAREQNGGNMNASCGVWCGCTSHLSSNLKQITPILTALAI